MGPTIMEMVAIQNTSDCRIRMDPGDKLIIENHKLEGKYANYFAVGFSAYEYVFDFGQSYSENEGAELYTRVVLSPVHAKNFLKTLKNSIAQFEADYGAIQEDDEIS